MSTHEPDHDGHRPRHVVTPEEWAVVLERHRLWLGQSRSPEARQANLCHRSLAGLDLRGVCLDRAILRDCDLRELNLSSTRLFGTDLSDSELQGADFDGNQQMVGIVLERAKLDGARLREARLIEARARGARFDRADLTGADLSRADLRRTTWEGATLRRARLTRADLRRADLRGVGGVGGRLGLWHTFIPAVRVPFTLDDTRVRGARFAASSQDPWSVLRRTYTGPRMIFVLILSLAALLPLLIQAALYRGLDQAERLALPAAVAAVRRSAVAVRDHLPKPETLHAVDAATRARIVRARDGITRVDDLLDRLDRAGFRWDRDRPDPDDVYALLDVLAEAEARLTDALEGVRVASARAANLPGTDLDAGSLTEARDRALVANRLLRSLWPGTRVRIEPVPTWRLLLGFDRGWAAVLAGAVLLYNLLRLALTYVVGPLRDEEERSGHAPARDAYRFWMYDLGHRIGSVLAAVALVAGSYQLIRGMTAEVLVPRFPEPAVRATHPE